MENLTSRLRRIARHFEAMWTGLHRWEMGSERLRGLPNKPLVVTADITDFKCIARTHQNAFCRGLGRVDRLLCLMLPRSDDLCVLVHAQTDMLRFSTRFNPLVLRNLSGLDIAETSSCCAT